MDGNASSQSGNTNGNGNGTGGQGDGTGTGGDAGSQTSNNTNQNSGGIDLKTASPEQLAAVLENPNLWKLNRLRDMQDKAAQADKLQQAQQQAADKQLEDEKKFQELAQKRATENEQLQKQIQDMTINQALTNKLVPLGVVDLSAAVQLIDRSAIKLGENGELSGVDEAITALKEGKAYLFNGQGSGSQTTVGTGTNVGNNGDQQAQNVQTFKRSQLRDSKFYQANREAILAAQAAGKIEDDIS